VCKTRGASEPEKRRRIFASWRGGRRRTHSEALLLESQVLDGRFEQRDLAGRLGIVGFELCPLLGLNLELNLVPASPSQSDTGGRGEEIVSNAWGGGRDFVQVALCSCLLAEVRAWGAMGAVGAGVAAC
jgi:hypothetical protein